nr:MAG TPA: hypothetical protein [Caudoviricetes sp.]
MVPRERNARSFLGYKANVITFILTWNVFSVILNSI